jgi:DNA-binding GntR family transcriptional regulator
MDQNYTLTETSEILHKRSLSDEVYEFLYKRIIAGKYSSGEWLRQDDISTLLGVSQTPVREAFDRLVASGLAERVPFRGVRVPKMEPMEIVDAYTMRLVLESTAARISVVNIQKNQIDTLFKIVEQTKNLITLEDMSTLRQLNKEFHTLIVEAAGNQLLSKLYEMATNSFPDWMLYEYMFRHPEYLQTSLLREFNEHKAIVEALASHDLENTIYQVSNHIKNLGIELESFLGISGEIIQEAERHIEPISSIIANKKI